MRGRVYALSVICVLASVVSACGGSDSDQGTSAAKAGGSSGPTKVSMRLDWVPSGEHTYYYAALEQGFFQKEGLDVKILEGGGSALSIQLIANKSNDFAHADFGAMAASIDKGVPVKMVANLFRRSPMVVISLDSKGIKTPKDLAGKTVGTSPASSPAILFPALLAANGLKKSDVKMANLDPTAYMPALFEGKVDAIVTFATANVPPFEIRGKELGKPVGVMYYSDHNLTTISSGIIANPETIEKRPEVVQKFVRAVQAGAGWTFANKDAAAKMMAELFPRSVTPEQAGGAIGILERIFSSDTTEGKPIGFASMDDAKKTLDALAEFGDVKGTKPVDEYVTNDFIKGS